MILHVFGHKNNTHFERESFRGYLHDNPVETDGLISVKLPTELKMSLPVILNMLNSE